MLATRAQAWKQQWLEEGRQQGLEKARQEARREGQARLTLLLLEHRFGRLPDLVRNRVATASSPELVEWCLRVLDAGSLEEILA